MILLQTILGRLRQAGIRTGLEAVSLIPSGLQRGPWSGRGIIFTLHHVRPRQAHPFQPNALLSITPEFLESAICIALESGLTPMRLDHVPAQLAQNDGPRFFAMTLDDGYRDNAEHAAPIFRNYGVPYTIFVTAGFSDRSRSPWWEMAERILQTVENLRFDFGGGTKTYPAATVSQKTALFARLAAYVSEAHEDQAVAQIEVAARENGIDPDALVRELVMDADELRQLAANDALASFGAHTLTHCNLKRVSAQRLTDEIDGSIAFVEAIIGHKPQTFAYPYGWPAASGEREARAVASKGPAMAVTTRPGVLKPRSSIDMHLLSRVSLNGLYQEPRYVRALISGLPFLFR